MSRAKARPACAAIEYNVARTARHSEVRELAEIGSGIVLQKSVEPLSAAALRVFAVLTGLWVDQVSPGCLRNRGVHAAGCPHRGNRVTTSLRQLGREAFGAVGGSQIRQVSRALDELSSETIDFTIVVEGRRYVRDRHHILSFRETGDLSLIGRGGCPTLVVSWDPLLLESLLEGHFQFIPIELVRGLTGEVGFRLWMQVLVQPAAARIRQPGGFRDFAVSGPDPTISLAMIGLGGSRQDRAISSVREYAERGNNLQNIYRVEVHPRKHGGYNVRLTLLRPRQSGPHDTATQDASHGNPGRKPRQPRTSDDLKGEPVDGFESVIKTQVSDSAGASAPVRPDIAVLSRHWGKVSERQVRLLDRIARRHGGPGDGWDWNAWHLSEAIRQHMDPIAYLKLQD